MTYKSIFYSIVHREIWFVFFSFHNFELIHAIYNKMYWNKANKKINYSNNNKNIYLYILENNKDIKIFMLYICFFFIYFICLQILKIALTNEYLKFFNFKIYGFL